MLFKNKDNCEVWVLIMKFGFSSLINFLRLHPQKFIRWRRFLHTISLNKKKLNPCEIVILDKIIHEIIFYIRILANQGTVFKAMKCIPIRIQRIAHPSS